MQKNCNGACQWYLLRDAGEASDLYREKAAGAESSKRSAGTNGVFRGLVLLHWSKPTHTKKSGNIWGGLLFMAAVIIIKKAV